jgi:molybdate/tungstate transport system permease protein
MNRSSLFKWIFLLLSGLVLLFIIAPLAGMFIHTGASEFFETARDKEVQNSIWLTLWVSFAGTFVFAIGGIPLAWLLARKQFPLKSVVQGIIDLPVVLPHTAAGIALLGFISRDGLLGKTASAIGLNLVNHPSGIALAMAFVSLPFLINSARDGFASVPERLEKAALYSLPYHFRLPGGA